MSLIVPNTAEVLALKNFLNNEAPQDQYLKLYCNNYDPVEGSAAGNFTEAAGGGYTHIALTGASWVIATSGGLTTASYAQQTFTFTGALTTNPTIYGYFVVQQTSGAILWAEKAASPFTPANNGDTYKVTPQITAE
jgi:hypothetical protein